MKLFIREFLVFILFFAQMFFCTTFAIDINGHNKQTFVTEIDFEQVLKKAQEHSYDLKIADFNKLISEQEVRGARSEYYPKLFVNAGTEYTKNYRDTKDTQVMAIGENFINPYTRYQSILGVVLTYNLFDFGVRGDTLKMAKHEVAIKELERSEKLQELNLNVLDTYTKILIAKKQIDLNKDILSLYNKNLEIYKRLYNAKEISKTELNDMEVKAETARKHIAELSQMMAEDLNWLEFYTGEKYSPTNIKIADIKKPDFDVNEFNDYTKTVIWKKHEKLIKQKEIELRVTRKANYPKINAYSRYYLYGSDHSNYGKSWDDFSPSNFTVGGSVTMPIFDGFKNNAEIKKKALELQQLQVERDKAIAQFMTRLASMRSNLIYLNEQITNNNKIISQLSDKEKSVHRLVAKRISSPSEENDTKADLLEQKIEYIKNNITVISLTKGIQLLTEEQ